MPPDTLPQPLAARPCRDPAAPRIAVIGLGYVGLPLAIALARSFDTIGLDIDSLRVAALRRHRDATGEVPAEALAATTLSVTDRADDARGRDVFIVTVPTPIDADNAPDLRPLLAATRTVATLIEPGSDALVVYESTVYPGVTEDVCGPEIERATNLRRGIDFRLGYSPERINPGDREHAVDRIVKVIAGETPEVTARLAQVYGAVTRAGVFEAASIRAAEGAKVIENAQRDINIAFMNEVAMICARLDLSVWDVLAAARTKWNFLPFQPGLVGGHCIGVDPYYLSHRASAVGHDPRVVLAGRATNDGMAAWVADALHTRLGVASGRVLALGLTFKENVPDLRNSKMADLVHRLAAFGHDVTVHDPLACPHAALAEHRLTLDPDALTRRYDLVLLGVPHDAYRALDPDALLADGGIFADLKGALRDCFLREGVGRWTL